MPEEISIWLLPLVELRPQLNELRGLLSNEEQQRAQSFRISAPNVEFTLVRACLRLILASKLNENAHNIQITTDQFGKPQCNGIFFNVSHSRGYGLIATSPDSNIGVDIEYIDHQLDVLTMSKFFHPDEQAELLAMPEQHRHRHFFTLWTKKEAWAKLESARTHQAWHAEKVPNSAYIHHLEIEDDNYTACCISALPRTTKTMGLIQDHHNLL